VDRAPGIDAAVNILRKVSFPYILILVYSLLTGVIGIWFSDPRAQIKHEKNEPCLFPLDTFFIFPIFFLLYFFHFSFFIFIFNVGSLW